MRALWLLGCLLLVSLALNAALYARLDRQTVELAALHTQRQQWERRVQAGDVAMETVLEGRQAAAQKAQEGRDALDAACKDSDDAVWLESLGRLWRERACPRDTDTARGAAR